MLLIRPGIPHPVAPEGWLECNILATLDGSAEAERVIPHVSALASLKGAETILLMVCEPPMIPSDRSPDIKPSWEEWRDQLLANCRSQSTRYLSGIQKAFQDQGLNAKIEVTMGKPAEEILNYTERGNIGLISITTHGRSGISRWAYGSVAGKIIYAASVPILIINARYHEKSG